MDAIERLRDLVVAVRPSADIQLVSVEGGLHSALMDGVIGNFKMYLEKVDFKNVRVPLVSGVDGQLIADGPAVKDHVIRAINSPIVWTRIMDVLQLYDVVIEVGPGTQLSSFVRAHYPEKTCIAINKQEDVDTLKGLLA